MAKERGGFPSCWQASGTGWNLWWGRSRLQTLWLETARLPSCCSSTCLGLVLPSLKMPSVTPLLYFIRPVWGKFNPDDFLRVLSLLALAFPNQKGDVAAKARLSIQWGSPIRRLLLPFPSAIFKSLIPAVFTDSGFLVQPPFFWHWMLQQTLLQRPGNRARCLQGNQSLQHPDCSRSKALPSQKLNPKLV